MMMVSARTATTFPSRSPSDECTTMPLRICSTDDLRFGCAESVDIGRLRWRHVCVAGGAAGEGWLLARAGARCTLTAHGGKVLARAGSRPAHSSGGAAARRADVLLCRE